MSDSNNDTGAANGSSVQFTEREMQMLGWAMQSLKTGPPEIDYEKLAGFAGMSNPRSASNAWAKIKNKLVAPNPDGTAPVAATPKKAGGRKKAAATPKADDGEEVEGTPKKTPRKRPAKKQDVDGDASPKKKGRAPKKKESDDEANVKAESDDSKDLKPEGDDIKEEIMEEMGADEV
ncbi:hypothetical protein FB567DRAFT_555135 [Paraphoma chrysanthemicola]|uniref:Uncharacterized protein n=1 Tax=Paraphoma chrysanthemicola TaxID=798071 RepID=A0A8K0QT81_9PLEO|nr:hypothetical protein FB567DRAFT_555135 [Paraphoma chrysanthemicola]